MDSSNQVLLEDNTNLRRQLFQQGEEIQLLQNLFQTALMQNAEHCAPSTAQHRRDLMHEETLRYQRSTVAYILSLEKHCHMQHEQLNQLKLNANKLIEASDKVMDLERMLLKKDMKIAQLEKVLMAETLLYEEMMGDLRQRGERWRRKYATLDFNIREKKRRKQEREEAFAMLTQVAPSLEVDESSVKKRRRLDQNVESEGDQVVGSSEVPLQSSLHDLFHI